MDQMAFDFMGDFFESPAEPQASAKKAPAKKAPAKNAPAKNGGDKKPSVKWEKYNGPVNVIGPNFSHVVGEAGGSISEKDVYTSLVESGFPQFKGAFMKVMKASEGDAGTTCLACLVGNPAGADDVVDISVPLTVVRGESVMELTAAAFEGKEQGEVSIADVIGKWVETYPAFEGCSLYYDPESNIAVPAAKDALTKVPAGSFVQIDTDLNEEHSLDGDGDVEIKTAAQQLWGIEFPTTVRLMALGDEGGRIIDFAAHGVSTSKGFNSGSNAGVKKGSKKKVMVNLPVEIRYNIFDPEEISPSAFGGKEKVAIDEIEKYISSIHPGVFTKETSDFKYFPEAGKVFAGLKSAKKG